MITKVCRFAVQVDSNRTRPVEGRFTLEPPDGDDPLRGHFATAANS